MADPQPQIGQRIIVTGLAGSAKSTLARALAAKTGLPLIYLDRQFWKPGWVAPTQDEWVAKQRQVLAGERWIADGNYTETLKLRVERADTIVALDMPWQLCVGRAIARSIKKPVGQMPEGCPDSVWRRFRDEWGVAGRVLRKRHSEPARERDIISEHGQHTAVHVLKSKADVGDFLARL